HCTSQCRPIKVRRSLERRAIGLAFRHNRKIELGFGADAVEQVADQAEGVNLIVVLAGGKLRDTPPRLPRCPRPTADPTGGTLGGGGQFHTFVFSEGYAK